MAYERITVVGNIGSIDSLTSNAGKPYVRLSVAVNRKIGTKTDTVWYSVLMFGSLAKDKEKLLATYKVGRLILVEGRPQVEAFIKKDGGLGVDNSIIAMSMPECLDARQ